MKDAHVSYDLDGYAGFEALFCRGEDIQRARNYMKNQSELLSFENHYDGVSPVAVLKNMWVEEEYRGNGTGVELLEEFLSQAHELDMALIYLVADTGEDNDFDLVSWYESNGFVKISSKEDFPLMYRKMT